MDNKLKQNNSNNEEKKLYYKSNISNDYFWNNIKQHPFSYGRGKIFFKIFSILFIIYIVFSCCMKEFLYFSIIDILVIVLVFCISLFILLFLAKKQINTLIGINKEEFYFYNDFFVVKTKNETQEIRYNYITNCFSYDNIFLFYVNNKAFAIRKKNLDKHLMCFLNDLILKISNSKNK